MLNVKCQDLALRTLQFGATHRPKMKMNEKTEPILIPLGMHLWSNYVKIVLTNLINLLFPRYTAPLLEGRLDFLKKRGAHLSTAVAWREFFFKHFVFNKYFSLVLGVLKSKISKKSFEPFLRKLDFKLFHFKAMVQPVSKITTVATRNRCYM